MKRIITTIAIITTILTASATEPATSMSYPDMRKYQRDSVKMRLATLRDPQDSLKTLYDLFDLSPRGKQLKVGKQIYDVATRLNNTAARLDILRQMTNLASKNDSLRREFLATALSIPPSDEQKATVLFIRMSIANTHAAQGDEQTRQQHLLEILKEHTEHEDRMTTTDDIYTRIERVNTICAYLAHLTQGEMLSSYLDTYGDLILKLPQRIDAITNIYYTSVANTATYVGDRKKAVEADKILIKSMRRMQNVYYRSGRKFRNYNANLYNSYRRMLSNYEVLSSDEVEDYYRNVQTLIAADPDVKADFERSPRPEIYYSMATKNYERAKELIKKELARAPHNRHTMQMLSMLKEAAIATDDKASLLESAMAYNDELENFIRNRSHERYRELQIMYDVNKLKDDNTSLKASRDADTKEFHKKLSIAAGIFIIILIIMLGILTAMYRRAKRLSLHLTETNEKLSAESENLRKTQNDLIAARDRANKADRLKTDFINNMSHEVEAPLNAIVEYSQLIVDTVSEEKHDYLNRFANIVTLSADLLQTLVNDVLTVNSIDNDQINVKRIPVSLSEICHVAMDTVAKRVKPGVKMIFLNENTPAATVSTDDSRVEQVLVNLLANAAKFTTEGKIELGYTVDREKSQVTFTVSDTGPGISPALKDKIFERFYKGEKYAQGLGLGLPICRLISRLLGGEVKLDTEYTDGAKFEFTIPI